MEGFILEKIARQQQNIHKHSGTVLIKCQWEILSKRSEDTEQQFRESVKDQDMVPNTCSVS